MEYSKTGKFTKRQKELAEEISIRLKELSESGCTIIGNSQTLKVYLNKEIEHGANNDLPNFIDYNHEVPSLNAGRIDDSSIHEIEYFRKGYIKEE